MRSSPTKSPNCTAKKICLETDSNNNLYTAADKKVRSEERIYGVLNLTSLFKESYINVSTKDLITIAFNIDLSCSEECTEQIEMLTRHRMLDKDPQWKHLQIGRICGSVFKDGKSNCFFLFTNSSINIYHTQLVCQSESKYPPKQLMSRIYRENNDEDISTLWSRKNFINVRTKYERIMLNRHKDFAYRKCGLVLRANHPQFCVTPGKRRTDYI